MKTKEQEAKNKKYKERFDPFFGISAQSERRAEGFDHNEHRALGVSTHISSREAGNAPLDGDRGYMQTLQQKPVKQPKGTPHKETNYFVDRLGVLYRETKFFDKAGNTVKTSIKKVKKGKVPKELKVQHEFALELQSTGGIASAPIGTKINIRKGDISVNSNISGRDRQKLKDLAEKTEQKAKEPKWYGNFFLNKLIKKVEPAEDFQDKKKK
jgi:hypothetical protein